MPVFLLISVQYIDRTLRIELHVFEKNPPNVRHQLSWCERIKALCQKRKKKYLDPFFFRDKLHDLKRKEKKKKKTLNFFWFWGRGCGIFERPWKNRMGGDKKHTYGRTWWPTDRLGPEGQVGENCMFIFVKYHNWKIFSKNVGYFYDFFYSRVFYYYKFKKITKAQDKFPNSAIVFFFISRLCMAWTPMIKFNKQNEREKN